MSYVILTHGGAASPRGGGGGDGCASAAPVARAVL